MRVALLNTIVPFIRGGAEILVDDLYRQLIKRGHSVTLFRIPWTDDYMGLPLLMQAIKLLNFDAYDKIIVIKFPTFSVVHRDKVVWMCHQFRQVYDLWNQEYGLSDSSEENCALKEIITTSDNNDLCSAKKIYTIGDETSRRLFVYNNIKSGLIYPPVSNPDIFYFESVGDYLYYPSRVSELKRQLLAVQAMKYTKTNVKLIISGLSESESYYNRICQELEDPDIGKKVKYINEWVSDEEKSRLMANSLGCVFIPHNEDYGYITLEAFLAKKSVITCKDSGGPTFFVEDGKNGYVTESDPKSIAIAIDELYSNREKAKKMGENGYQKILDLNITWDSTIERLLELD